MNTSISFRPKLLDALRDYTSRNFLADLVAGITVGIVALPLAMAFAIASGVKPAAGIFTAVIAGFLISALGGSRVSIGGPTGAFVVILYGIGLQYGANNLVICTLVFRVFGAFFFGAVDKLETALQRSRQDPDVLILRMRKVLAMDATGLNSLEDLYDKLRSKGKHLVLSGPPHPAALCDG
jgi:MFS superfamily sulfate permease-like transporter